MKIIKIVSVFLLAMLTLSSAYAGTDADYTKTVTGQGGALFSLSKGDAAALVSVFDAIPKIYLYKYTGSQMKDIYKLAVDRGNDKSPHGRIIFPPHSSNQDYHVLEVDLPSGNEGSMKVNVDDLDMAEIGLKKQFAALEIEFKKMGIVMPAAPAPESQKAQRLAMHREMYGVAKQSKNINFRTSTKFTAIDDAYVAFKPEGGSYYTGTVHGRYVLTISLNGIAGLASCDDVEAYIDNYMAQFSFSGMPSSKDK
jgi:hypothetical protein